jgi:threonine dehydrogenase-like Zn-dependent dehydrogenase
MATKQEVEAAYLLLLGRPPEDGAVDYWLNSNLSTTDILKNFLSSDEFRINKLPQLIKSGFSSSSLEPVATSATSSKINKSMCAAVHLGIRDVGLIEMEKPVAIPGTMVIKIGAVGICGSDLSVYRTAAHKINTPRGHEYSGVVVDVGDDVQNIQVGQRVTVDIFLESACGECKFCRSGYSLHCKRRKHLTEGGFAEYVRVNASAGFILPENVDDALGALTEPLAVAVHAIRKMNISPGMSGVVIGAGTIGLMALAAAIDAGASRMYVVARYPFQAEAAISLGAIAILENDHSKALNEVFSTNQYGVDFAIEAVGGRATTLNEACEFVRPLGSVCVLGAFESEFEGLQPFIPLIREINVLFSNCYGYLNGKHDFEVAIDLLSRKGESLRKLITHEYSLANISEAFRVAEDKKSGAVKVQIRP